MNANELSARIADNIGMDSAHSQHIRQRIEPIVKEAFVEWEEKNARIEDALRVATQFIESNRMSLIHLMDYTPVVNKARQLIDTNP